MAALKKIGDESNNSNSSSSSNSNRSSAGTNTATGTATSMAALATAAASTANPPTSTSTSPLSCPPDRGELGRAGWTVLHSFAAYFPLKPTKTEISAGRGLVQAYSTLYPCEDCRDDFSAYVEKNPLPRDNELNRDTLSMYLCRAHNDVNKKLNKKQFDCSRILERYRGLYNAKEDEWEIPQNCTPKY